MPDRDSAAARPDAATAPDQAGTAASGRDAQVVELQERVAELDGRWRRALADLDNVRKRYEREAEQSRALERMQVATAWLPVLDHLELALSHAAGDPAGIVEGVRGVRDEAVAVLAGLGFERRNDVGVAFDPARHEAVAAVPTRSAPAGTVVDVVRPAYGEGARQLRPAAVVVAATPAGAGDAAAAEADVESG